MITAQFRGGLGNQLFQVAATVALAKQNGDTAAFNFNNWRRSTQGNPPATYRSSIFRNLPQTDRADWEIYSEPRFEYQSIEYRANLQLRGLFQSAKYFEDSRDFLLNLFSPSVTMLAKLQISYRQILSQPNCAIHIRRGDYLKSPGYYRAFDLDYYWRAIELFPDRQFLIFSDDLDYAKHVFIGSHFSFAERNSDEEDLYLMSLCDHQIIANSTFSWWGAYLRQLPCRIISPRDWFAPGLRRINTDDIYTINMEKI